MNKSKYAKQGGRAGRQKELSGNAFLLSEALFGFLVIVISALLVLSAVQCLQGKRYVEEKIETKWFYAE